MYHIVSFLIIFLLVLLFVGAIFVYFYTQYMQQQRYADRAQKMLRLRVILPKKEEGQGQESQNGQMLKESLGGAEQLLSALHGIRNEWVKGMLEGQDYFGFEIVMPNAAGLAAEHQQDKMELEVYVLTLPEYRILLEKQINSLYPDAAIEDAGDSSIFAAGTVNRATAFTQKRNKYYPLKTYASLQADPMNSIINAISQVKQGEGAAVQILFCPAPESWTSAASGVMRNLQEGNGESKSFFSGLAGGKEGEKRQASPAEQEHAKGIGEKLKKVGFHVKLRAVVAGKDAANADATMRGIVAAFSQYEDPQQNALYEASSSTALVEAYKTMDFWHSEGMFSSDTLLLNSEEIVSLVHFPDHRFNPSPALKWLSFRKVGAPANTPREGIQLGTNDFQGVTTEVRIKKDDRTRHFYCIGKSGSGKSTLLEYMIKQDIRNGDGVCVIDPHGDLAEAVLPYIPKERANDVIYFNPGDTERPAGLNLLEAAPDKRDFITGQALEIFIKLFGEEVFSPRLQHYFRNACLTLMDDEEEGGTLIEIPRLFIDPEFQKAKVAKVKNPVVRAFWEKEIANTGDREKQEMIPYLTSKFGQFITDSTVRNVIGQAKSSLDMRKAMDERKIVLVNLAKGVIGEQNMSLMGMILVAKVQMAAMSRFDTPAKDRKDFYLYVDEFQNFATDSFGSILSEARKYRLNLIVAHQYIKQLKDEIRDAVFGNVGSMMCFKIGADDAEHMAKEYAPVYSEQDIVNIPNYKAYIKLCIDNATSTAFSMNTVWDKEGKNDELGEKIRQMARLKLGRKKEFVEAETRKRAGG